MDLYSEPVCCIRIGSMLSKRIKILQGVIQGAPMSMINYEFMSNDLLKELKNCSAGTAIGPIITTCPAFADDLTIIAPSRTGLQKLINRVYKHSQKWRYEYNATKCAAVVFHKGRSQPELPFQIGNACINVVVAHEHVGTCMSPSKWAVMEYVEKRIEACNKPGYTIMSIGSRNAPMTPKSASTLYWSICIPKLTYGFQMMDIPNEAMQKCESYHARMAKVYQGLPGQCSNAGSVAGMGWLSVAGHVDLMRLTYFMRIIRLGIDCIYKRVFIIRYCYHMYETDVEHCGPLYTFIQLCQKYGLIGYVKNAVEECIVPGKSEWKKLVRQRIWNCENRQWGLNSTLYRTLSTIKCYMPVIKMLPWWEYTQMYPADVRKCRIIARLLLDCNELKYCKYRYKLDNVANPFCDFCDNRLVENAPHILFQCCENYNMRRGLWESIKCVCPETLLKEITCMSIDKRTSFILSGLGVNFVREWIPLYKAILYYVYTLYRSRISVTEHT